MPRQSTAFASANTIVRGIVAFHPGRVAVSAAAGDATHRPHNKREDAELQEDRGKPEGARFLDVRREDDDADQPRNRTGRPDGCVAAGQSA